MQTYIFLQIFEVIFFIKLHFSHTHSLWTIHNKIPKLVLSSNIQTYVHAVDKTKFSVSSS